MSPKQRHGAAATGFEIARSIQVNADQRHRDGPGDPHKALPAVFASHFSVFIRKNPLT